MAYEIDKNPKTLEALKNRQDQMEEFLTEPIKALRYPELISAFILGDAIKASHDGTETRLTLAANSHGIFQVFQNDSYTNNHGVYSFKIRHPVTKGDPLDDIVSKESDFRSWSAL